MATEAELADMVDKAERVVSTLHISPMTSDDTGSHTDTNADADADEEGWDIFVNGGRGSDGNGGGDGDESEDVSGTQGSESKVSKTTSSTTIDEMKGTLINGKEKGEVGEDGRDEEEKELKVGENEDAGKKETSTNTPTTATTPATTTATKNNSGYSKKTQIRSQEVAALFKDAQHNILELNRARLAAVTELREVKSNEMMLQGRLRDMTRHIAELERKLKVSADRNAAMAEDILDRDEMIADLEERLAAREDADVTVEEASRAARDQKRRQEQALLDRERMDAVWVDAEREMATMRALKEAEAAKMDRKEKMTKNVDVQALKRKSEVNRKQKNMDVEGTIRVETERERVLRAAEAAIRRHKEKEDLIAESVSTSGSAVKTQVIRLTYETGWERAFVHYSKDGGAWTKSPGVAMRKSVMSRPGEVAFFDVEIEVENGLEFVLNNGEGSWDSPRGGNYAIGEKGRYSLREGKITQREESDETIEW